MNKEEIIAEARKATPMDGNYDFIGITAYHQMGDLSRDFVFKDISQELTSQGDIVENMFHASKETEKFYVGAWHTGFGFFDVLFPKETSRPLTENELKVCPEYTGRINSQPSYKHIIKTKQDEK